VRPGITVADAAIPETGTVLLRTTQGQPDLLSLLPRVHLALVMPGTFLADIHQAFALAKGDRHFVLVSGIEPHRGYREGPDPRRSRPQILSRVDLRLSNGWKIFYRF